MMRKHILLAFVYLILLSPLSAQRNISLFEQASAKLQKDILADSMQGSISIAVFHKNDLIWSKAFGNADPEKYITADTATIYRIASLTKSFTATLLMKLVEQGIVKLDDAVELYVPEVKQLIGYNSSHPITLHQLATHTSGLSRRPDKGNVEAGDISEWENKLLHFLPVTSIINKPGAKFLYSNVGYVILGLALERAAHKPYIQLVEEDVFKPLELSDTYFTVPESKKSRLAVGIDKDSAHHIQYMSGTSATGYGIPAGGIYSTPGDLVKFLQSQIGIHPILSIDNLNLMHKGEKHALGGLAMGGVRALSLFLSGENKQIVRVATHSKYGIGFSMYEYRDLYAIGHSGRVAGYSSQYYVDRNSGYGVVILRNYAEGRTNLDPFAIDLLEKLRADRR